MMANNMHVGEGPVFEYVAYDSIPFLITTIDHDMIYESSIKEQALDH